MNSAEPGVARKKGWLVALALLPAVGCQQQMADSPFYKPYEPSSLFADGRSNRPLVAGTVHHQQWPDNNPLVTGLTEAEWDRIWSAEGKTQPNLGQPVPEVDRNKSFGAPRFDPREKGGDVVFATDFPFEITPHDLRRGEVRYTAYCAACHGPLGNGKGKIWERGYLEPTSFHTEKVDPNEPDSRDGKPPAANAGGIVNDVKRGFSRGYWRWGIQIPLREAPVGYYFEVISKGYGGMPAYAAQIKPDDRWRIIAYVRLLQEAQQPFPKGDGNGGKK